MKLKSNTFTLGTLFILCGALTAAQLEDDFSAGLDNWTTTVILDNGGDASNVFDFQVNDSGQLELETTVYDNIEQYAFLLTGAALEIGEEAQVDMVAPILGNRNLGIYVGGTAPVAGVQSPETREDYITIYGSSNNSTIFSRGFDGTSEYDNPGAAGENIQSLFIARTEENTFEAGFYTDIDRIIVTTRIPGTPNTADFVGIYADVRAAGTVGAIDAFRIIELSAPPTDTEIVITTFAQNNDGQYVFVFTGPGNGTFAVMKSSNLQDDFPEFVDTVNPVTTDANGDGLAIISADEVLGVKEFFRIEVASAIDLE
ncbi:MAG: hypothetical protein QNL80_14995 [Akkermansiaceae bacterium]